MDGWMDGRMGGWMDGAGESVGRPKRQVPNMPLVGPPHEAVVELLGPWPAPADY